MKYLGLILGVLVLCAGCATEADRAQWEAFRKELQGEGSSMTGLDGSAPQRRALD